MRSFKSSLQIDLMAPSPCRCGWPADINEYPDEVRIGGWCFCPAETMPIAYGRDFVEAREDWEMQLSGSLPLAEPSALGGMG